MTRPLPTTPTRRDHMRRRWLTRAGIAALAAAAALGAAACGGDDDDVGGHLGRRRRRGHRRRHRRSSAARWRSATLAKGGTYRIANTDFANSDGFDPSGEYFGSRLDDLQHDHAPHAAELPVHGGRRRATSSSRTSPPRSPRPRRDGLTYTFTIKDGITFGPPVNREITSQDILYSFERIGTPSVAAQYAFYYTVDRGLRGVRRRARPRRSRASRRPDDKTHQLQADRADRRLPLPPGDAGDRADPGRGGQVPHRRPASTGATSSPPART